MAAEPVPQAEILMLARLLRCRPERLSYLERVPAGELRALREQVTNLMFGAHNETLERLAAASRLLPVALTALIAERAFGPVLAARMAGVLEPARAVAIAARLPAEFLAETACEIDPRRASAVIGGIPVERIVEVARILATRGDYVTMGQAVSQLSREALAEALGVLDDEQLLRVAFVIDDKQRLPELAELLGHERLIGMIDIAERSGLEEEAIDLLSRLDQDHRGQILDALRQRDEKTHRQVLDRLGRIHD